MYYGLEALKAAAGKERRLLKNPLVMNYKPDEATWTAYLYGELADAERRQVEKYLQQHPKEQKRVDRWSFTRSALGTLTDKVITVHSFGREHLPSLGGRNAMFA